MIVSFVVLLLYMTCLYVIASVLKNNGVADIGYGIAFIVVLVATYSSATKPVGFGALLLLVLPTVWGVRLATRIFKKNYGKPEDFRYKAWRDQWGSTFWWRSFLQVYMLQGLVIYIVALPITLTLLYPASAVSNLFVYVGVALWLLGFYFEAVGDYQLDTFIRNPENKGKIMTSGLWSYSRHPNYFGESTMWVGIFIIGLGSSSLGIAGLISPILITYLLLYVSGVPMLEKKWEGNPMWEEYKRKTSVFIPLPPRV